jgi:hypothetical protein
MWGNVSFPSFANFRHVGHVHSYTSSVLKYKHVLLKLNFLNFNH